MAVSSGITLSQKRYPVIFTINTTASTVYNLAIVIGVPSPNVMFIFKHAILFLAPSYLISLHLIGAVLY